jgi:hypothetical protein
MLPTPRKLYVPAAVRTPVTRRPPHSPGRAVFPHPVPRLYALPRRAEPLPVHALMAIPRREVGSYASGPTCPGCVSCAGCVLPSSPSPCGGLSPPPSTTLDTTPHLQPAGFPSDRTPPPPCCACRINAEVPALFRVRVSPCVPTEPYTILRDVHSQELMGPPTCFDASLPACHGLTLPPCTTPHATRLRATTGGPVPPRRTTVPVHTNHGPHTGQRSGCASP